MGRARVFRPDERVELIDGEIIQMSPIKPPHQWYVNHLTELFVSRFRDEAMVSIQGPAVVELRSEPQPDLLLVRRRDEHYRTHHPEPGDILLVVEVSDTTLAFDRRVKAPLYARVGIPEHWRFEVKRGLLVVHRDPSPAGYQTIQVYRRGESIALLAFPDRPIAVDDLLG